MPPRIDIRKYSSLKNAFKKLGRYRFMTSFINMKCSKCGKSYCIEGKYLLKLVINGSGYVCTGCKSKPMRGASISKPKHKTKPTAGIWLSHFTPRHLNYLEDIYNPFILQKIGTRIRAWLNGPMECSTYINAGVFEKTDSSTRKDRI